MKPVFVFKDDAIWINLKERDKRVNPYALLELLWNCCEERCIAKDVRVKAQILKNQVSCYFFDNEFGYYQITWKKSDFINSAIDAINAFCEWRLSADFNENDNHYCNIKAPHAEFLIDAVSNLSLSRNYSQIFIEDINIVDFSFQFIEDYSCDTGYALQIGEQCYRSCLSDWSNDCNCIRHEIEQLCYGSSTIELHFEDSPVTVNCKIVNLFSEINGWFTNEDIVKVTMHPDEFARGPIRFGWCRRKEVVRELYLGLLRLCTTETKYFDNNQHGQTWDELRLVKYNQLQSCIIENFLQGIEEGEWVTYPRQRWINSVEELKTDYIEICRKLKN